MKIDDDILTSAAEAYEMLRRDPYQNIKTIARAIQSERDRNKAEIERLRKLDAGSSEVESLICMRTHFDGEPPYVGWTGLALALKEHLDRLEAENARMREALAFYADPKTWTPPNQIDVDLTPIRVDHGAAARAALKGEA